MTVHELFVWLGEPWGLATLGLFFLAFLAWVESWMPR